MVAGATEFSGKEQDVSGLDYFGARYYDGQNLALRWISADSVTARVYDPPSLNKYHSITMDFTLV